MMEELENLKCEIVEAISKNGNVYHYVRLTYKGVNLTNREKMIFVNDNIANLLKVMGYEFSARSVKNGGK